MSYCTKCGRSYEEDCVCIHTTDTPKWIYSIIIVFVMFVPMSVNTITLVQRGKTLENFNYMLTGAISLSIVTSMLFLIYFVFKKNYIAIFYGCHQKTSRSIHYHNYYFVLCARCTGIQIGIFLAIVLSLIPINPLFYLILAVPMLVDGILQQKTKYISNNLKRVITGIFFGPVFVVLFGGFYYFFLYLANEIAHLI